jgi:S-adenosyl-L-homocysteine hydrolase
LVSKIFSDQPQVQIELFTKRGEHATAVHVLPKALDEQGARLHLDALRLRLTEFTEVGRVHRRGRGGLVQGRLIPLLSRLVGIVYGLEQWRC